MREIEGEDSLNERTVSNICRSRSEGDPGQPLLPPLAKQPREGKIEHSPYSRILKVSYTWRFFRIVDPLILCSEQLKRVYGVTAPTGTLP